MTTPTLRTLPKKKNAIQPNSMRWLKHIYDVYHEVDSTLLQRPEAIEAYNRLYDKMDTYKYAFAIDYPTASLRYECGILPFRYTADTVYTLLRSHGSTYTQEEIKELETEENRQLPYYVRRYTWVYPNGTYRLARMLHSGLSTADIKRRLGVDTLEGTAYTRDIHDILRELTELYIQLFDTVKDVLEPAILKLRMDLYRKKQVAQLERAITKKNTERIRVEEKYKASLRSIENELDQLYEALDRWSKEKKEDN